MFVPSLSRTLPRLIALFAGILACHGTAAAESRLVAGNVAGGNLPLSWNSIPGRMYRLESSLSLDAWAPLPANLAAVNPLVATGPAMSLNVPVSGPKNFYRLSETLYIDPPWADVKPLRTIHITHDGGSSTYGNGARLRTAIMALVPGDHLVVGPGTYGFQNFFALDVNGTAQAPIWITSDGTGIPPIITRFDNLQNSLFISGSLYLGFRGFEITGGSSAVAIGNSSHIWLDSCHIHHSADSTVMTTHPSDHLYITRNDIHDADGTGNAITLGISGGSHVVSDSVVGMNHIHNTVVNTTVTQGTGIAIRQGSGGNMIAGNLVEKQVGVGIFVVGTDTGASNVVENNICLPGGDNAMHIVRGAVVRNNLAFGNPALGTYALISQTTAGVSPTRMTVVNNTFVSTGRSVRLSTWSTGTAMLFSNNACYSRDSEAVNVPDSAAGVTFSGLVCKGTVAAGISFTPGTGLTDFVNLSWDGTSRNAAPATVSPLRNAADASRVTEWDLDYKLRTAPFTSGACR